jgi:hypothetical protein
MMRSKISSAGQIDGRPMQESVLVESISEYLGDQSFRVVKELPFLQRHIDIVGYRPSENVLIAVEAKIKNWQVALRQALTCLLFADEVYIAMPAEYIHRVDQSELGRFGIGLLEIGPLVKVVCKPISLNYASDHHRDQVVERFWWLEHNREKREQDA